MSAALFPYMASRGTYPLDKTTLYGPTMAQFPYNGTITFRWGESQNPNPSVPQTTVYYALTAMGQWGGIYASHVPIVFLCSTLPAATVTYATKAAMQADVNNHEYDNRTAFNTTTAAIAGVGAERWFCHGKSAERRWVPIRARIPDGTATIGTSLCDIYYCEVDVADIPQVGGESMDADEVFDLCWAVNGRHAEYGYDAAFKLTPTGAQLQDQIVERIELNARVAGQRSIKQDEMITRSQLEAGTGINLVYRDWQGTAEGYSTAAPKGYNIIVERTMNPILTREWRSPALVMDGVNLYTFLDEHWLLWEYGQQIGPNPYTYTARLIKWQVGPYGVSYKAQPTTTVGFSNTILEYSNSFSQPFASADWHLDKVVIDPITQQPTTGDARSIEILKSGYYRIHTLIDGIFAISDFATGFVFNAHLMLRLYWKKDAAAGVSHILDRWQHHGSWPNLLPLPEEANPGALINYENLHAWGLSGDQTMYLQAGTRLWSGFTGICREPSDYRWHVVPTYHYFEIEYLGDAPATVNQYPNRLPTTQSILRA